MSTSEQVSEIYASLSAAQGEFPPIPKTKPAIIKGVSKSGRPYEMTYFYADIADVLAHVLPVLSKHKLSVSQPTVVDGNTLMIRTRLAHASGQWIESEYPVCGLNGDHQKMGAAMTYARRYALCSLIGVAADEDTDGRNAAEPEQRKYPVAKPAPSERSEPHDPPLDSRAEYIESCTRYLTEQKGKVTRAEIEDWWRKGAKARDDFEITILEANLIKSLLNANFPKETKPYAPIEKVAQ